MGAREGFCAIALGSLVSAAGSGVAGSYFGGMFRVFYIGFLVVDFPGFV